MYKILLWLVILVSIAKGTSIYQLNYIVDYSDSLTGLSHQCNGTNYQLSCMSSDSKSIIESVPKNYTIVQVQLNVEHVHVNSSNTIDFYFNSVLLGSVTANQSCPANITITNANFPNSAYNFSGTNLLSFQSYSSLVCLSRIFVTISYASVTKPNAKLDPVDYLIIALIILAGIVVMAFVIAGVLIVRHKRKHKEVREPETIYSIGLKSLKDSQISISIPWEVSKPVEEEKPTTVTVLVDVEIRDKLGAGNFSEVFKGVWKNTTPVALKLLLSEEDMKEFMSEAILLQSLNHPHIVRFFGIYYETPWKKFIVTELMVQGNLSTYLQKNKDKLTSNDLVDMSKQAADGMRYLESCNVVHRDLALRNLLLTGTVDNLIVKVVDFGLGRKTRERGFYHTKGNNIPIKWSAPEVYHEGISTSKSDTWSFGVVLWEIFSWGRLPYAALNNSEVVEEIDNGYRMPPPKKMPTKVAELMSQCWKENPVDRPTFQEIFSILCNVKENQDNKKVDLFKTPYEQMPIIIN